MTGTPSSIARASIAKFEDGSASTSDKIDCTFNPESLTVTLSNQRNEEEQDSGDPIVTIEKSRPRLSTTLFFDTSEEGSDVRAGDNGTGKLKLLAYPAADATVPQVKFSWGGFAFVGLIESLTETLEFWSAEGIPLRSSVQISMSGAALDELPSTAMQTVEVDEPIGGLGTTALATKAGNSGKQRDVGKKNGVENLRFPGIGGGGALGVGGGIAIGAAAGFKLGLSAGASVGFGFGASAGGGLGIGLGAGFGLDVGIGLSANVGFSADVSASMTASAGFGAGASFDAGSSFDAGASFGAGASTGFGAGAGFGGAAGANAGFGASASAFAGAGFGASGGAFGGSSTGFGSVAGSGGSFGAMGGVSSSAYGGSSTYSESYAWSSATGSYRSGGWSGGSVGIRPLAGLSASEGAFAGLLEPPVSRGPPLRPSNLLSGWDIPRPGPDSAFDLLGRATVTTTTATSSGSGSTRTTANSVRVF